MVLSLMFKGLEYEALELEDDLVFDQNANTVDASVSGIALTWQ